MAMSLIGGDADEAAQMCAIVVQLGGVLLNILEMSGVSVSSALIFPNRMDLLAWDLLAKGSGGLLYLSQSNFETDGVAFDYLILDIYWMRWVLPEGSFP